MLNNISENGEFYGLNDHSGCEYRLNASNTTQNSNSEFSICNFYNNYILFYLIILIIIGFIGNLLTIIIFSSSTYQTCIDKSK